MREILVENEVVYISLKPRLGRMLIAPIILLIISIPLIAIYVGIFLLIIAVIWLIYRILLWRSIVYALTNRRVIMKMGIIGAKHSEAPVDKIQNIFLGQGILGRLFGYGEIEISTAGIMGLPTIRWKWIPHPRAVLYRMNVSLEKIKKRN